MVFGVRSIPVPPSSPHLLRGKGSRSRLPSPFSADAPPGKRRVEGTVTKGTLASVAAHGGRARQVGPEAVEHSGGTVETDHAMAGVHERLGNRHAFAAPDVQNARPGRERSGDRERFRHTHGPAAIRRIPIRNEIVLTHALRVRLYTSPIAAAPVIQRDRM